MGLPGNLMPHAQSHTTGTDKIATGTPNGTKFLRDDFAWVTPTVAAGPPTLTVYEANLGAIPRRAARFSIATSGQTTGKPVFVSKAAGPYTGKGTRADEAEMDEVTATGYVVSATQIDVFWQARHGPVRGNMKFAYLVGG